MRRVLFCVLALLPLAAHAGKITMSEPEEQELQGGKRLQHLSVYVGNELADLPLFEDVRHLGQ